MVGTISKSDALDFLRGQWYGHLGCHAHDRTYVVPISYVLDGESIIGQTKAGLKIDMMRANPNVCLQVEETRSIAQWKSVIAWGRFEELKGFEAIADMTKLIDHLGPQVEGLESNRSPRDVTPGRHDDKPQVDIVYRIHLDEVTGRFEAP